MTTATKCKMHVEFVPQPYPDWALDTLARMFLPGLMELDAKKREEYIRSVEGDENSERD